MTYPTTGFTPSVSQEELDANYLATLQAMVEAHPDNQYWKDRLEAFLLVIELERDSAWLQTWEIPNIPVVDVSSDLAVKFADRSSKMTVRVNPKIIGAARYAHQPNEMTAEDGCVNDSDLHSWAMGR